ncbi:MAG: hypothetical protein GX115_17575 [Ruminiclostridium sp.]|nr:hypothetical protein [Ruminiclostridium sp.]
MKEGIFRKQSLDRISSPEQLTDYIRVTNPSVWIILGAIVVLLISVLIWSVFGALPSTLEVNAFVRDGTAVSYVDGETAARLKQGMSVQLGEYSGEVLDVADLPISAAELGEMFDDEYIVASLTAGQWNYPVTANISGVPDGLYSIIITIDKIKPISFILN